MKSGHVIGVCLGLAAFGAGFAASVQAGVDDVAKRLTGVTFRCEQMSGTGRGDIAEISFDPSNRLRRNTLAGSRGAGKTGGAWTLSGGAEGEVRIRVVYDTPGWGTSLTSIVLTPDGFDQFEVLDGQRIQFMTCRKR